MGTAADDDLLRVETCTDQCGANRSKKSASIAADDDLLRVEICSDQCGPNRSKEAVNTAADDDLFKSLMLFTP